MVCNGLHSLRLRHFGVKVNSRRRIVIENNISFLNLSTIDSHHTSKSVNY